jgi:hypothetical protein
VFTARYALSPYIKQIRSVFKGLMCNTPTVKSNAVHGYCSKLNAYDIKILLTAESILKEKETNTKAKQQRAKNSVVGIATSYTD